MILENYNTIIKYDRFEIPNPIFQIPNSDIPNPKYKMKWR